MPEKLVEHTYETHIYMEMMISGLKDVKYV